MMSQAQQWTEYGGTGPEIYERYLVPAIFGPWAQDLIAFAAPKSGERVLDVACGTGIVARLASQRVGPSGTVVGLDLNPAMLAVARTVAPPSDARIEWQEGSVNSMPFANAAFDLSLCQQGLQFFPDRPAALREMHRVLVSDGRLVVSVWRPIDYSPGFAVFAKALGDNIGPEAAAFMQGPFALGSAEELRSLMTGTGFRDVLVRSAGKVLRFPSPEELVRRYVAATPLAGVVTKATEGARNALISAATIALRPYVDVDGLALSIETHLAMAYA